jgi:hypothetical protein
METYRQAKKIRLAKILFNMFDFRVIHLIASYDGTNGILMFPVEQNASKGDVQYRLRWPESEHAALREWSRPRTVTRLPLRFALVDPAVPVEAQWRFAGDEGWEDCVPTEFGDGVGEFDVTFLADRAADDERELEVMGMSGDFPAVFRIFLPAGSWSAGESIKLTGIGLQKGPGQYFSPGGFVSESARFRIRGLKSQATLLPVEKAVAGKPDAKSRGFMVMTGSRLKGNELDEFLKQKEVSRG